MMQELARRPHVGESITPVVWKPTQVQLFRFSAVTWNSHRIHYDKPYAQSEGYPDVLVQSQLHGCFLVETVLRWAGSSAMLRKFRWENRHYAVAGDTLTCSGVVVAVEDRLVHCELQETNQHGKLCAPGWATVEVSP